MRRFVQLVVREVGFREVVLLTGLGCLGSGLERISLTVALIVVGVVLLYLAALWPGPGEGFVRRTRREEK